MSACIEPVAKQPKKSFGKRLRAFALWLKAWLVFQWLDTVDEVMTLREELPEVRRNWVFRILVLLVLGALILLYGFYWGIEVPSWPSTCHVVKTGFLSAACR